MNVRPIALLAALLPFFAVHATYLVAATYGQVDWCLPYIDSCTSISATGRNPPASYLFRSTMLPAAVIMMMYWWLNYVWLEHLGNGLGVKGSAAGRWMLVLGLLACFGLILYVTVLGEDGRLWARQRRIGTVLFFSFTYIAQLLLVGQLWRLRARLPTVPTGLLRCMWCVSTVLLFIGIVTVGLDAWDEYWYAGVEDAFEWLLSLLLQSNFLLGYLVWRRADWRLVVGDTKPI